MIIDCISDIEHLEMDDNSFLLVRVGNERRPASIEDIEHIKKCITELNLPNLKCLVTHHAVDFQVFTYPKGADNGTIGSEND